jgi:hypothetical protein
MCYLGLTLVLAFNILDPHCSDGHIVQLYLHGHLDMDIFTMIFPSSRMVPICAICSKASYICSLTSLTFGSCLNFRGVDSDV